MHLAMRLLSANASQETTTAMLSLQDMQPTVDGFIPCYKIGYKKVFECREMRLAGARNGTMYA